MATVGCAAAPTAASRRAAPPEKPATWEIRVETSGGFAGTGRGAVTLASTGDITVVRARGTSSSAEPCRGRLGEDEVRRLVHAIEARAPSGWRPAGLERAAPDAFRYRFTLRFGEGSAAEAHAATWYDNTADLLPEDLAAIYQATAEVWSRVAEGCRSR